MTGNRSDLGGTDMNYDEEPAMEREPLAEDDRLVDRDKTVDSACAGA